MVSHLNTDMIRPSSPESVTDSQSLASSVNKQPQAWRHYIEKLNTQLDELISRNEALLTANEITQELHNELNQAKTEVIQLQAVNVHLQQQVNRLASIELSTKVQWTLKYPDSVMFNGDRIKLCPFLTQLWLKLSSNADWFLTEKDKLGYTVSHLEGITANQILLYVTRDGVNTLLVPSVEILTTLLTQAFSDPNSKITAQQKMHNLKQANWDFSTYLAEFLHLTSDTEYDDNTKLTALREGLSHELHVLLLTILNESDNFDDYVKLLQKLDSKQQVKKQRTKTYAACTSASIITVSTTCINPDNANNTLSLINVICSTPTVSSTFTMTGTHSEPMNLSSGCFVKLSQEEKDCRNCEELCQYCEGAKHIARVCLNISKSRPMHVTELNTSFSTDKVSENA